MTIFSMSVQAGVLITVIFLIRAAALQRLPKRVFLILWGVALIRALVPFTISSPFSVSGAVGEAVDKRLPAEIVIAAPQGPAATVAYGRPGTVAPTKSDTVPAAEIVAPAGIAAHSADSRTKAAMTDDFAMTFATAWLMSHIWRIYAVGFVLTLAFFIIAYIRGYLALKNAVPVTDGAILRFLPAHGVRVLQSNSITSPIALGFFRPKIILPAAMETQNTKLLRYIMEHEMCHIQRKDALWKVIFAIAVCAHWFNPAVWLMFWLFCRDLELACDEAVIRSLGADNKCAYACALLDMAQMKRGFTPLYSGFNKNAAEERIVNIMKYKKPTIITIILAAVVVVATTIAFATNTAEQNAEQPEQNTEQTEQNAAQTEQNTALQANADVLAGTPIDDWTKGHISSHLSVEETEQFIVTIASNWPACYTGYSTELYDEERVIYSLTHNGALCETKNPAEHGDIVISYSTKGDNHIYTNGVSGATFEFARLAVAEYDPSVSDMFGVVTVSDKNGVQTADIQISNGIVQDQTIPKGTVGIYAIAQETSADTPLAWIETQGGYISTEWVAGGTWSVIAENLDVTQTVWPECYAISAQEETDDSTLYVFTHDKARCAADPQKAIHGDSLTIRYSKTGGNHVIATANGNVTRTMQFKDITIAQFEKDGESHEVTLFSDTDLDLSDGTLASAVSFGGIFEMFEMLKPTGDTPIGVTVSTVTGDNMISTSTTTFYTREQLKTFYDNGIEQHEGTLRRIHRMATESPLPTGDATTRYKTMGMCDNSYYYIIGNKEVCSTCGYIHEYSEQEWKEAGYPDSDAMEAARKNAQATGAYKTPPGGRFYTQEERDKLAQDGTVLHEAQTSHLHIIPGTEREFCENRFNHSYYFINGDFICSACGYIFPYDPAPHNFADESVYEYFSLEALQNMRDKGYEIITQDVGEQSPHPSFGRAGRVSNCKNAEYYKVDTTLGTWQKVCTECGYIITL